MTSYAMSDAQADDREANQRDNAAGEHFAPLIDPCAADGADGRSRGQYKEHHRADRGYLIGGGDGDRGRPAERCRGEHQRDDRNARIGREQQE